MEYIDIKLKIIHYIDFNRLNIVLINKINFNFFIYILHLWIDLYI
jgi:hypothetical protein